jgi:hypothetical protein
MEGINLDTITLVTGSVLFILVVYSWHLDRSKAFNISDLLVNARTGRFELFKLGQFICLMISSWIVIFETRSGRLTEWEFGGYMVAWAGANLINKAIDNKAVDNKAKTDIQEQTTNE